jgi:isopropylmalate/homocitrate/citramalate synthase
MTGPDHYRAAEQALDDAAGVDWSYDPESAARNEANHLARAQTHASLAMLALTVDVVDANGTLTPTAIEEWLRTVGREDPRS